MGRITGVRRRANAVPFLLLVFLFFPSASWHTFDGLPLSSLSEFAALILILPLITNRSLRRLYGRFLVRAQPAMVTLVSVAIVAGLSAKVGLLASGVDAGFFGCYQAVIGPEIPWICEKSYENPFFRHSVTRIDETIDFGPLDWNLSFFNSLRFNFDPSERGTPVPGRLPFASTWRSVIHRAEAAVGEVAYVGEGELRIYGTPPVQLPPSYLSLQIVGFEVPAGRHALLLTYKFDDGSRVADGKPRGPNATLRLRAPVGDSQRAQLDPLRSVDPPAASRAASLLIDLVTLAVAFTIVWFYWRVLEPDKWVLGLVCVAGVLLLVDPTAYVVEVPGLRTRGLPNGLGLTVLAGVLLVWLLRHPSLRSMLVGYFSLFWVSFFRQDFQRRGFDSVLYRGAGDDWLTYESFGRSILEIWSPHGGESVFYYQPLFRYIKFGEHLLFGDGDTLVALFAHTMLVWTVLWVVLRMYPRGSVGRFWRALTIASGVLLVVLVTSEPVSRLVYVGASEHPTWIAFPLLFTWLSTARSPREWRLGTLLLGLSILTRMNHAAALAWVFVVFLVRIYRRRPWVAMQAVTLLAALAVLPGVHNVYYGGTFSLLPGEHNQPRTLPLPPSSWLRATEDGAIRAQAIRQVRTLWYATTPPAVDYYIPTELSHRVAQVAFHGLQAIWLIAAVILLRGNGESKTAKALLVVPALYLAVHLFYQVTDYHPRSIVIAHVAMGTIAIFAVRERVEAGRRQGWSQAAGSGACEARYQPQHNKLQTERDEAAMVTPSAPKRSSFLHRLIGAVALRAATYEEVEADRCATWQAVAVVVFSSVAAGLGARGFGANSAGDVAFFSVVALMAWVAWTLVVFEIGARILPGAQTRTDVGELLRTTGFASAPGLLRLVGVLPGMTIPSFAVAALWMLVAMIIAVRQALDYTNTRRAIAVCGFGWVLAMTLAVGFGFFFGPRVS